MECDNYSEYVKTCEGDVKAYESASCDCCEVHLCEYHAEGPRTRHCCSVDCN